jgi:N-acetylglucosamine-6-phosphate deacetylase
MTILTGATLVLPDRTVECGTLTIEAGRIAEVLHTSPPGTAAGERHELGGHVVVPGFVDVHIHGVERHDTLDDGAPIREMARCLVRHGVTAFCPTTVACSPERLEQLLGDVAAARESPEPGAARVLPAHLESNFVNPDFRGAQPLGCLRLPPHGVSVPSRQPSAEGDYAGADVMRVLLASADQVGIVTLAPELSGALELIRELVGSGCRVSLGHSGASYEEAWAGIEAGARQATHLFNRMPPLHHRDPGLVGAVLEADEIAAELVCDCYHVHPAVMHAAIAAKRPARMMAITDGTGGSGLPVGAEALLGGRRITVRDTAAFLDDGTLAGSVLTMERAFRNLVERVGLSLVDAALMCATTPARELRLAGQGALEVGALADLVVLDGNLRVAQTWVGGELAFSRGKSRRLTVDD